MKIFKTQQIRDLDKYTIEHEPVLPIDLMERASRAMADYLLRNELTGEERVLAVCGNGNNGGDGLAIARILQSCGIDADVIMADAEGKKSADCETNLERLRKRPLAEAHIEKYDIVIDAMFGSGLNRPVEGRLAETIDEINRKSKRTIAVDVPSGLYGDDNTDNPFEHIVRADVTMTLQQPKLSFLMPETEEYVGNMVTLPIGISEEGMRETETPYILTEKDDLPIIGKRSKFGHKGTYGHVLMIGGSEGKAGAMYLSTKACLRTGAGLVTAFTPETVRQALQVSVPEVMCLTNKDRDVLSGSADTEKYTVTGIGCGLGTDEKTVEMMKNVLMNTKKPMVIDADGLNIISQYPDMTSLIPKGSVLTPHPKEWERLSGISLKNRLRQIEAARKFATERNVTVVLKGAYTVVATSDGMVRFNTTGNPGMATAGSGDVLCGIVLGLMAQGMSGNDAAVTGVYIHGTAGDVAAERKGQMSMIASDIIENIGKAIEKIGY